MEAGQILHNNPVGFPCPEFVTALVVAIREEIGRVYWNVNQKSWLGTPQRDRVGESEGLSYETGMPGIEWRPYYNWGGDPEDDDWDQAQANAPNFACEGVEIRWYKRFGRSMNTNVVWPAANWVRWFERVTQTIRAYDDHAPNAARYQDPEPYPDPQSRVPLDQTPDDLRHIALMEKVRTLEAQMNCIACVCLDVERRIQPRFDPEDWRWCQTLEWVSKMGRHALKVPGFKIFDEEEDESA
jgi:hypothetical protein